MLSERATDRPTKTGDSREVPRLTLTGTGGRGAVAGAGRGKGGTDVQWVRDPFTGWKELWMLGAQQCGRTEHHGRSLKVAKRSRFR